MTKKHFLALQVLLMTISESGWLLLGSSYGE
ncbi:hypothetical protein SMU56_03564 [Streptococcus mutans N29]|nr:hypothetical protein SMU56_03564 [Streptococcus mutans N29]